MEIAIFTIPFVEGAANTEALNKFLATHTIIEVKESVVEKGWTFCVKYDGARTDTLYKAEKPKPDYKEILSPEEFSRFCAMRKIRKEISDKESIPAFTVFTDAELASMSRMESLSLSSLKQIKGLGKGRVDKYGELMIARLAASKKAAEEDIPFMTVNNDNDDNNEIIIKDTSEEAGTSDWPNL